MKMLIPAVLAVTAVGAQAQTPQANYPSCNLTSQRALVGQTGGAIKDAMQAHISMRANVLEADIGSARKARLLTQQKADALFAQVQRVRRDSQRYARQQGFLSAAERASYDRTLDAVAMEVCGQGADANAGGREDLSYLLKRADTLNRRIDQAASRRALSREKAASLHLSVRRVQTFVGNQQARLGTIARPDADRMNQQLTDVERALTNQP